MRFKRYLKEKYFKGGKIQYGDYIEVFVNPSKKEMREVASTERIHSYDPAGLKVRFLADMRKKNVYVHSPEITHHQAWFVYGDGRNTETNEDLLTGTAVFRGGKWYMEESDSGAESNLYKYTPDDWKWVDKYIIVTDYLELGDIGSLSTKYGQRKGVM